MLGGFVSNKPDLNLLIKPLHYLVYPFLTGFLLDLPWLNQLVITVSLAFVVLLVGNFADALVLLWQAIAVSGFVSMIVAGVSGSTVDSFYVAVLVPVFWFLLSMNSRRDSESKLPKEGFFTSEFFTIVAFIYLAINAPRGRTDNLNFISHQDNAKQLMAPMQAAMTGQISLEALALEDRESVGYFAKYVANFALNLGLGTSDPAALLSINAISNTWILALVSFLVIGTHLNKWLMIKFELKNKNLFLCVSFVILFRSFYVTHLHGFLPLFILGLVGVIFIYTIREFDRESNLTVFNNSAIGLALGFSMFGSWQPWAPLGFTAVVLVVYKALGRKNLRFVVSPIIVIPCLVAAVFVLARRIPGLIQSADLESGGPAFVDTEVLIVFGMIIVVGILMLYQSCSLNKATVQVEDRKSSPSVNRFLVFGILTAVSFNFILKFSQNQTFTIMLLLLVGYIFANRCSKKFSRKVSDHFSNEVNDGPFIFFVVSFGYIVAIYLASRFIGPNYYASYAAHKSATAFLSQFAWVPLLVIGVLSKNDFVSTLSRVLTYISFLFLFSFNVSINVLSNSGEPIRTGDDFNWIGLKYEPKSQKWWHSPVVKSLRDDEDQILICSNSDLKSKDWETYVCNRFLHSLFKESIQSEFRHQTSSIFGPRPEDLSGIRLYLQNNELKKSTLVFSKEALSDEMLALFSSQDSKTMKFQSGF